MVNITYTHDGHFRNIKVSLQSDLHPHSTSNNDVELAQKLINDDCKAEAGNLSTLAPTAERTKDDLSWIIAKHLKHTGLQQGQTVNAGKRI